MTEPAEPLPPGPMPAASERRVSVRYRLDEDAVCRFGPSPSYESRWARVRDVSVNGVGLRLAGTLLPGMELLVEFRDPASSLRRALAARVVHATAQEDGTWLVGCRFDTPLGEEELASLLAPARVAESVPASRRREPASEYGSERVPVILIADDQSPVRALLGHALRLQGFATKEATSGKEAVALLRQQQGEIGLAILDLRLPGQGGLAALAALQQLKPGLRCCVMSGDPGDETALLEAGACCVLRKPFTLNDVARCVATLLQ